MIRLEETKVNVVVMNGMDMHHGELVIKMGLDCRE